MEALQLNQILLTNNNRTLERIVVETNAMHTELLHNQNDLSHVNQALVTTNGSLLDNVNSLNQLNTDVVRSTSLLQSLDQQFTNLENGMRDNQVTIERHVAQLNPSGNRAQTGAAHSAELIEENRQQALFLDNFRALIAENTALRASLGLDRNNFFNIQNRNSNSSTPDSDIATQTDDFNLG